MKVYASIEELTRAFNSVRRELANIGLLSAGSSLDKTECWHERLSFGGLWGFGGVMGFFDPKDGGIHVPAVYPAALLPCLWGERKMLDVIRHEFGHVLADRYGKFFRGGEFKAAFGANYGETKVFDGDDWSAEHVSAYASTMTQEDFTETFMLYLKHKGMIPPRYRGKRMIERKWRAVAWIVKQVATKQTHVARNKKGVTYLIRRKKATNSASRTRAGGITPHERKTANTDAYVSVAGDSSQQHKGKNHEYESEVRVWKMFGWEFACEIPEIVR